MTLAEPPPAWTETTLFAAARALAAFCAANAPALDCDDSYPSLELRRLGALGLLAAPLRRSLGGLGLGSEPGGMANLLRLLAILGSGSLAVARLYEGHVNALLLIQQFGTADQIAAAATAAREDQRVFAVWNTDGEQGARLTPLTHGQLALTGEKSFASGAGFVDRPLVTAALPDGGWQLVVLDAATHPIEVDHSAWRPIGMKASASGRVRLTTSLTGDALVGAPGDYYRQPWFGAGALRFAAAQLGAASALADAARADVQARHRADEDAQRGRMGQIAIAIESGRLWLTHAAALADRSACGGAETPEVSDQQMVAYASMVRTAIERICLDVIEHVHRSVGAHALLKPHAIERISRDLVLYLRQPAPDAALRAVGGFAFSRTDSLLEAWGAA